MKNTKLLLILTSIGIMLAIPIGNMNAALNIVDVDPWEKISVDFSSYCGSEPVQIRVDFDSGDDQYNNYRGWLVDHVKSSNNGYNLGIHNGNESTAGDEFIWKITKVDEIEMEQIWGPNWQPSLENFLGSGACDIGAKRKFEITYIDTYDTFWEVDVDTWFWTTGDFADVADDNVEFEVMKDGADSFGNPVLNNIIPLPVEDYLQDIQWDWPYVADGTTVSGDDEDCKIVVKYCPTTGVWEKFQIKNTTEDVVYELELIFTGFSLGVEEDDKYIYKIASYDEDLADEYIGSGVIETLFGPDAVVGAYDCLEIYDIIYSSNYQGWIIYFEYWNWTINLSDFDGPSDEQITIPIPRHTEDLGSDIPLMGIYAYKAVIFPIPVEFYLTQIKWKDITDVVERVVIQEFELVPGYLAKFIGTYNTDGVLENLKVTTDDDQTIFEIQLESAGGGNGGGNDDDDDGGGGGGGDGGGRGDGGSAGSVVNFLLSPIGLIAVGGITAAGVAVVIGVWFVKKRSKR